MAVELIAMCAGILSVPVINNHIITPLKNHISYAFTLDSKVETLSKQVEELQNMEVRLQQSVVEATQNGDEIFANVTEWLSTVTTDMEAAKRLIEEKEEANKKCCVGFCPNFKTSYQLSKKAHKKALAIEKLQNVHGLYPISFWTRPQQIIECGEALQSRVVILDEIVDALKDPNLKDPILVYGMGGIGKTTLANEVQEKAVEEKLFDDVVFVAVSETPNLKKIQEDLAEALGLKFHAGGDRERANELHRRLKDAKALIILDDVWEELKLLSDIGIPSGEASKCCRIFLTSRKKYVLCHEMPTKKEFPLGLLEEEEAWTLFDKILNKGDDPAEFLANNRDFCDLGKQVVNKCGGLPLLIQIVATELRNNKHLHAWRDMLKQLESVKGTEVYDKVHKVIESSYEKMINEEAKSVFLLCPLFGNSNIRIQDLLVYCVGLGLFKIMDSIEGSRDRVLALIDKLKNDSLLLDGDMAGFVKIHDVVRDIAAKIASEKHCAFVGKGQIRSTDLEREDFRRVSLPYCEIPKLPEVLQCPEAEVFSVFGEDLRLDIPDSFFEGVKKLKVLHFSGVSSLSSLPSSLSFLTGLQTLSLDGCRRLKNVAMVANLKQLEVLIIVGSYVKELPREMEGLTRLKILDLTGCDHLKVIPSNVLSNLHSLEELYMLSDYFGYDGWGTEANASLVELKNLSRLTTLEIKVKDDKLLPVDWFSNRIKNYKISIGDDWFWNDNKETSRVLKLELKTRNSLMDMIKEFMGGIEVLYLREVDGIEKLLYDSSMKKMNSFQKLQCLHLKECNSLREVIPFSSEKCLPHLEEMEVYSCDNMEVVVGEGNGDQVMKLTQLTSLKLMKLPNLIGICRTSGTVFFPNLRSLRVSRCNSLKYVFTTSMVKSLQQLKRLDIEGCDSMEEIILVNEFEEAAEHSINEDEVMEFPQLTSLRLTSLPICRISGGTVSFPNLTSLEIEECGSLKYVFTPSMAKSLKQLKKLWIHGCHSIKEIILVTKFEEVVVFPELKELKIKNCYSLKNFVSKGSDRSNSSESTDEFLFNGLVSFPNLTSLKIKQCDSLKYVFTTSMVKSLKQLKKLDITWCDSMEDIILVTKFEEVVEFSQLKELQIRECSSLKNFVGKDSDRSNINESSDEYLFNELVSFPNLTSLKIYKCKSLKYVFTTSMVKSLKQLKKLYIEVCDSMEEIILLTKCDEVIVFPELDSVQLKDLPNLKRFICGYDPIGCPELRKLEIKSCPEMKNFVSKDSNDKYFFNQVIPNVEVLTLDHHSLKAITESDDHEFPSEPWKLKEVTLTNLSVSFLFDFLRGIYSVEKLVLRKGSLGEIFLSDDERATGDQQQQYHRTLKHLELRGVSKLKHLVKEDSQLNLISQCFQTLIVEHCDDMMNIAPSSSSSVSFINLTTLHVFWCHKMTSLVTTSTAKSMIQLMELQVSYCYMMEDIIVANEDGDSTEEHNDVIIFDKLKKLELDNLSILNSFCSANYNFSFPLLEKVSIQRCYRMKKFCGGEVSTPKLQEIQYQYKQLSEGNLNAIIASQLQQNRPVDMKEDGDNSSEM